MNYRSNTIDTLHADIEAISKAEGPLPSHDSTTGAFLKWLRLRVQHDTLTAILNSPQWYMMAYNAWLGLTGSSTRDHGG